MEFEQTRGIYQQIADSMCERILRGEWTDGARISSIRETAIASGVNPNTVTRSYQFLLDRHVIENKRGVGYFVSPGAREKIMSEARNDFIKEELPKVFRKMDMLSLVMEDVSRCFEDYKKGV